MDTFTIPVGFKFAYFFCATTTTTTKIIISQLKILEFECLIILRNLRFFFSSRFLSRAYLYNERRRKLKMHKWVVEIYFFLFCILCKYVLKKSKTWITYLLRIIVWETFYTRIFFVVEVEQNSISIFSISGQDLISE